MSAKNPTGPSILRRLFGSFVVFGLAVALLFPFYADFFVEWKPGMYVWFVAGCVVAGTSIGVVNYFLVKWVLLGRLQQISRLAQAVNNKDLSRYCEIHSNDVIGEIASSLDEMINTLRNMIRQVSQDADVLSGAANNMAVVSTASARDAEQQQKQIEQVATAMNEMAASAQEVARHADEAANATREAHEQGNTGKVVVVEAMGAVDTLADMVDKAAVVINTLEKESVNIGNVLAVINGIAEQTNLLALNAAIEAARAGEQGRGFAVVADEVRTLANRTQKSTEEISQMIERLQSGSRNAVQAMHKGSEQAKHGVALTEQAAEALAEISGAISVIKDMSFQIANAATQQSAVVEEVNQNITTISTTSTQSRDNLRQVADTTQEVSHMASQLNALVAGFKIE